MPEFVFDKDSNFDVPNHYDPQDPDTGLTSPAYACRFINSIHSMGLGRVAADDFIDGEPYAGAGLNYRNYQQSHGPDFNTSTFMGNYSLVRQCSGLQNYVCMNYPTVGQEYFSSLVIPCTLDDQLPSQYVCPDNPTIGMMFNPCMAAEVLIEVTNDGEHYTGGVNLMGSSILSTTQFQFPVTIYDNFRNTTTPPTFAVYTYIYPEYYFTNVDIPFMDNVQCLQPRFYEEGERDREKGWFLLKANEAARLEMDYSHLPTTFKYGEHYQFAISIIPSRCYVTACDSKGARLTPPEVVPCQKTKYLSQWFMNPKVPKNVRNNMTLYALDDLLFHVEVEVLYGAFESSVPLFLNSTSVQIVGPTRAKTLTGESTLSTRTLSPYVSFVEQTVPDQYFFCVYFPATISVAPALNLPPQYKAYERGRALTMYNASAASINYPGAPDTSPLRVVPYVGPAVPTVPPMYSQYAFSWSMPAQTSDESKEMLDAYFETFQQTSYTPGSGYNFAQFQDLVIPYLPYFSNCAEYDKYIPLWMIFEDQQCELPDIPYGDDWYRNKFPALPDVDSIVPVGPWNILGNPVGDWCQRTVSCQYDEDLTVPNANPVRWFEASTGTLLFYLIRRPLNYLNYTGRTSARVSIDDGGGGAAVQALAAQTVDNFIPVVYDHSMGDMIPGCSTQCMARNYILTIAYYQEDYHNKRIILATFEGQNYDFDQYNVGYELEVIWRPLGYIDLILNFAYDITLFLALNFVIGIATLGVGFGCWLVNRLTTHLQNPPELKMYNMLALVVPPPFAGVALGVAPVWFLTMIGNFCVKGVFIGDPGTPLQAAFNATMLPLDGSINPAYSATQYLDSFPLLYGSIGTVPTEAGEVAARTGRIGTVFVVIGFLCFITGMTMFYPKAETKRELAIAQLRTELAKKADLWTPIVWKKIHFVYCSFFCAVVCTLLVEQSLWVNFGDYVFEEIMMIFIVFSILDTVVDVYLADSLVAAPIHAAHAFMQGFVTFGASNFISFIVSYFFGYALSMLDRLYLDQILDYFISTSKSIANAVIGRVKAMIPKYLNKPTKSNAEGKEVRKKREVEGIKEEEEENEADSVEPLLYALVKVGGDNFVLYFMPYMVYLLMQFRNEIGIPTLYGIRQSDMKIYLVNQICLILFQPFLDIFNYSQMELYHGWKVYEYLVYSRYRFLQRETRWKGMEDSLDECIDESLRRVDQMCFSAQYYMMVTIQACGIVYVMLGFECWIRVSNNYSGYSVFSDVGLAYIVAFLLAGYYLLYYFVIYIAVRLKIWRIKHENTAWHMQQSEEDDIDIPGWEDVKGASHEAYLMNQRITSETFRYKFLNYNRAWLINQLPQLLTPRTMRRSRPYLINQLSRIINARRDDISDDSDGEKDKKFGPVALSASSRTIIRWWLGKARRRLKLKNIVEPLIRRARGTECEQCLSRKQLQVEYEIDIDTMADRYDRMYPEDEEVDQIQWKSFWSTNQRYHTHCLACLTKRKEVSAKNAMRGALDPVLYDDTQEAYPDWGPVFLSAASKAILLNWYRKAQRVRAGKKGRRRKEKTVKAVSDDEGDDVPSEWVKSAASLSASTKAIAVRWMRTARARLQQKAGKGAGIRETPIDDELGETFRSGKKSRQLRK